MTTCVRLVVFFGGIVSFRTGDDITLSCDDVCFAYDRTDIISYFHKAEIYHTVLAVYRIAQAIYHFIRQFKFKRKTAENIF